MKNSAGLKNKPRYNLRNNNPELKEPQQIFMKYRHTPKRLPFTYPTRYSVVPENWNVDGMRVRMVAAEPHAQKINRYLSDLETEAETIALELLGNGPISDDELRHRLQVYEGIVDERGTTVIQFTKKLDKQLNDVRLARVLTKLPKYEQDKRKGEPVYLSEVTISELDKLRDYLCDEGLKPSYIGLLFGGLRRVMKKAFLTDETDNRIYLDEEQFKFQKSKTKEVALDLNQVIKLEATEITHTVGGRPIRPNRYSVVCRDRDAFVIDCLLGLRHSDLDRLDPDRHFVEIDGVDFIKIIPKKTSAKGTEVFIPMHRIVKRVLARHGWQIPKPGSQSQFNASIKIAAKNAGFTEAVERVEFFGTRKEIKVYEFWELVKPHTARRTLATVLLSMGFTRDEVKQVGGWSSDTILSLYDKRKGETLAREMAKNPFWDQG